jgi:hypothetical protein
MQTALRNTNPDDFSEKDRFIQYYEEGKLLSPEEAAKKILDVINDNSK